MEARVMASFTVFLTEGKIDALRNHVSLSYDRQVRLMTRNEAM